MEAQTAKRGGASFRGNRGGRGRGRGGRGRGGRGRGGRDGQFKSKYDLDTSEQAMERKRKSNQVEYFKHPPTFTEKDREVEAELEDMLFGAAEVDTFGQELDTSHDEEKPAKDVVWAEVDGVMMVKNEADGDDDDDDVKDEIAEDEGSDDDAEQKKPQVAWEDEDDASERVRVATRDPKKRKLMKRQEDQVLTGAEYTQRLRERYEKLSHQEAGGPTWAKLPEEIDPDDEDDEEEKLLATTESLVSSHSQRLPPSILRLTKLRDANIQERTTGLHAVSFHPNGQLLLVAGMDKSLKLFQVSTKKCRKMHGVIFKDMPIAKAWFSPDGREAIAAGRRPYMYVYDVLSSKVSRVWNPTGRNTDTSTEHVFHSPDNKYLAFCSQNGYVSLVSNQTKKKIGDFKTNTATVNSVCFASDGYTMLTGGNDAHIYQWDLRTQRCIYRFADEGMSKNSSLAMSPNGAFTAVGSQSGVVNVYSEQTLAAHSPSPKPEKALMNLQTTISSLKFNHDTQLLGISSWAASDSFRMVHLPSLTVFQNWPNDKSRLGRIMDFDFSPSSGFIALGNNKGSVLLYRLNHYPSA